MQPKIKIVGVGGSGSNTISRMFKFRKLGGDFKLQTGEVELLAINTDAQALSLSQADKKILIGRNITGGLGTGMDASLGRRSAEECREEIAETLKGTDVVFVTCGLGGGTGSGASSIISEISKNLGILTIAVVTMPFSFEGLQRKKIAEQALDNLKNNVDSLIVIYNDKLLKIIDEKTTVSGAFLICDDILRQATKSITDLILEPGIINIDFALFMSIMKNSGQALFGVGNALGEKRAITATQKAIDSPLLDFSIKKAKVILFSLSGNDITLNEIQEAAKILTENADSKVQIIFGATKDKNLKKGEVKATLIATGINK